jgi:hypothetical protein
VVYDVINWLPTRTQNRNIKIHVLEIKSLKVCDELFIVLNIEM